jgi:hypothetical protein
MIVGKPVKIRTGDLRNTSTERYTTPSDMALASNWIISTKGEIILHDEIPHYKAVLKIEECKYIAYIAHFRSFWWGE